MRAARELRILPSLRTAHKADVHAVATDKSHRDKTCSTHRSKCAGTCGIISCRRCDFLKSFSCSRCFWHAQGKAVAPRANNANSHPNSSCSLQQCSAKAQGCLLLLSTAPPRCHDKRGSDIGMWVLHVHMISKTDHWSSCCSVRIDRRLLSHLLILLMSNHRALLTHLRFQLLQPLRKFFHPGSCDAPKHSPRLPGSVVATTSSAAMCRRETERDFFLSRRRWADHHTLSRSQSVAGAHV